MLEPHLFVNDMSNLDSSKGFRCSLILNIVSDSHTITYYLQVVTHPFYQWNL